VNRVQQWCRDVAAAGYIEVMRDPQRRQSIENSIRGAHARPPAVRLAEEGYLRVALGGSVVPAAATADDLGDYVKAVAMKDNLGVQEMSRQERLLDISGGTRVHVIDLAARFAVGMSRVRVLDGPLAGTAVWVLDNSLATSEVG
jgi:hypothetical protein